MRTPYRARHLQRYVALCLAIVPVVACETTTHRELRSTDDEGKTRVCTVEQFTGTEVDVEAVTALANVAASVVGTAAGAAAGLPAARAGATSPDLAAICADSTECVVMTPDGCFGVTRR